MADVEQPLSEEERAALDAWTTEGPQVDFVERVFERQRAEREVRFSALRELLRSVTTMLPWRFIAIAAVMLSLVAVYLVLNPSPPSVPTFDPTTTRQALVPGSGVPIESTQAAPEATATNDRQSVHARRVTIPQDLESRIDALVQRYGEHYGEAFRFHGVVAVAHGGDVVYRKAFGWADIRRRLANTTTTQFRIGGLTIPMTAVALFQLERAGKLNTNAPLARFLPEFPGAERITLEHLLMHRSGIVNHTALGASGGALEHEAVAATPSDDAAASVQANEVLDMLAALPLEFEPGSEFDASNGGYFVLGSVIEQAAGMSYAHYLQTHVFEPAKMHSSVVGNPSETATATAMATGHTYREDETLVAEAAVDPALYGAAGAVVSTADDVLAFVRALADGTLLDESTRARMWRVDEDGAQEHGYTRGWVIDGHHGFVAVGHPGGVPGFNAQLLWFPVQDLSIVVLANSDVVDAREVAAGVAAVVFDQPPPPYVELQPAAVNVDFDRYVGTYCLSVNDRPELGEVDPVVASMLEGVEVERVGSRLRVEVPNHARNWMYPLGSDRFFFKDPARTLATFRTDAGGRAQALELRDFRQTIALERCVMSKRSRR